MLNGEFMTPFYASTTCVDLRHQVSSIEGCFDREFIRSKPKVSSVEAKVSIEE